MCVTGILYYSKAAFRSKLTPFIPRSKDRGFSGWVSYKKMSELIKSQQSGLISLLHSNSGGLPIPKPFEKEIFLFDTHVAGTSFVEGIIDLAPSLHIGDRLNFFSRARQPLRR